MCISTVHSAEAGESSQSDSCQPSVLSGDSRHCSDVESEVSDASSDSIPEECPSPAQQPASLPVPSEGSSPSLLDIGVLIKGGTLRSLDKSMKLKLIKQAPDAKFNYPTSLCMVATDGLNRGPKAIHGYITVHLRMVSIAKLASCSLLLMLSDKNYVH